ncbi:MAG: membrane protein insertion efficiency factor YidD [Parachlamydiaceae bacterium]|nr:membrane protein insertion efficiency factor YidD [Parachlamydiaceae bacterium]
MSFSFTRLIRIFLISFFFSLSIDADPWGKDACLCKKQVNLSETQECHKRCPTPFLGLIAEGLIAFHQDVISPADGPRSHFLPSSSQYTLEAMRKYGFYSGFLMGCDRLMRENSEEWVYRTGKNSAGQLMKLDPVP